MRLPWMTTRRWMVVVAVVGLVMGAIVGGVRLKQRKDRLLSRMRYHVQCKRYWCSDEAVVSHMWDWDRTSQLFAYHAAMARKYQDAASCPLLPIEPDPPEPPPPRSIAAQPLRSP